MLEKINFKTELDEIITAEEIAILFDSVKRKSETELIALSIFPKFNQLKKEIIAKTKEQRNAELSKLLSEIINRKKEIIIKIEEDCKPISDGNTPEKKIQNKEEIEQIIYEKEQIKKTYKNIIKSLEIKEKKIMSGKYIRITQNKSIIKNRSLKKQLTELKEKLIEISLKHDNCFIDYYNKLEEIIEESILTDKTKFSKMQNIIIPDKYFNIQTLIIKTEEKQNKDFYLYEPNENNSDDSLIYQLLTEGIHEEMGTINELLIPLEYDELEEL